MAGERHDPLLRSDRTGRCTGQVQFLVLLIFFLFLLFQGGGRDGNRVRRPHRRDRGRVGSGNGIQAVRGFPMWVFLGLADEHHGHAVARGVCGVWVRWGWVSENVVVRAEERRLDLWDGELGR